MKQKGQRSSVFMYSLRESWGVLCDLTSGALEEGVLLATHEGHF